MRKKVLVGALLETEAVTSVFGAEGQGLWTHVTKQNGLLQEPGLQPP